MRWLLRPQVTALVIALAVFCVFHGVQHFGWLQRQDLSIYDMMLRGRHDSQARNRRITLIKIDEDYVRKWNFPLQDDVLANVLEDLLNFEPRAIGLDLYRDLPEPRDKSKLPRLEEVLTSDRAIAFHLTAIFSIPQDDGSDSKPPPCLKDTDRVGFNDFPSDNGVIRRALLLTETNDNRIVASLALRLAEQYLESDPNPPPGPMKLAVSQDLKTARLGRGEFRIFQPNDGGYRNADAGPAQILLDFKSPDQFDIFSLEDVLKGNVPITCIYDRIILIGNYARSYQDFHITPLGFSQPGALIHAQILNQLLRTAIDGERPIQVLSPWMKAIWALAWSMAGGMIGLALLRRPAWSLAGLALGGASLVFGNTAAFRWGWWLPPVEPAIDFVVVALLTMALVFIIEKRQRSELMQLFSRHVSEKVASDIWRNRESFLDGQRPLCQNLRATVVFTDFAQFSAISEAIGDPTTVMNWLNEAMEQLVLEVEKHDGVINKFIGDSIMAIFGAPIPSTREEDIARDAVNAVRCALAMGQAIERLNTYWKATGRDEIAMRVGIYTGQLVSGSVGSANRLEFTVIGDSVNTASRLESTRKDGPDMIPAPPGSKCRILIGEPTYELLGGRFEAEYVGEEELKGKKQKIRVYRVLREIYDPVSVAEAEPLPLVP